MLRKVGCGCFALMALGIVLYVMLPAVTGLIFSQPIVIVTNPFITFTKPAPKPTATPKPTPQAKTKELRHDGY